MKIHGLNKTTLLDYPGRVAATIFTGGCNLRCPYCHNGSLVLHPELEPTLKEDDVLSFLRKRYGILSGVCITGGEPTLQKDLTDFITKVKSIGYAVKLDTNGFHPDIISELIKKKLIDCIAMDIKASIPSYEIATGMKGINCIPVMKSVDLIMCSSINYEFRTTIVKEIHNDDDFIYIGNWLKGAQAYFLQSYRDSDQVITSGLHSFTKEELEHFRSILLPYIPNTNLRGIE